MMLMSLALLLQSASLMASSLADLVEHISTVGSGFPNTADFHLLEHKAKFYSRI